MTQQELQFSPVEMGDLSEIPPDAPDGDWVASCNIKISKTQKDELPMFILEYKLEECLTEANAEWQLPTRVSKFLVFRGKTDQYVKMFRADLAAICAGHGIPVPNIPQIKSTADLQPLADALMANRLVVRTKLGKADKQTGEKRTEIGYPKKTAEVVDSSEDSGSGKKRRRG